MTMFPKLIRWDRWANRQVLDTLDASGGEPPAALAAFQHVLETEVTWLGRFGGNPRAFVPGWQGATLDRTHALQDEANRGLDWLTAEASPEWLASAFDYENSRGEPFRHPRDETLMHMLMHSSQYRGEAAGVLNAAGRRVPDLDFAFWLRAGEPD
ncbi:MAG: hypothetical protein IPG47_13735 [Thermoflexaceae bacterium]|nr:hypothetical protein [Thermoflexaceae bacterium]